MSIAIKSSVKSPVPSTVIVGAVRPTFIALRDHVVSAGGTYSIGMAWDDLARQVKDEAFAATLTAPRAKDAFDYAAPGHKLARAKSGDAPQSLVALIPALVQETLEHKSVKDKTDLGVASRVARILNSRGFKPSQMGVSTARDYFTGPTLLAIGLSTAK